MSGGGTAPNGNTSNLPLFGTPEQQLADPLGLFPGAPPPPTSMMGNLGASTMIPYAPNGNFSGQSPGTGAYNYMAGVSAGPLFNPSAQNPLNANRTVATPQVPTPAPTQMAAASGSKGGMPGGNLGGMLNQATSLGGLLPGIGGGNGQTLGRVLTGGL